MNDANRPFVDRPVGDVGEAQALAAQIAADLGLPPPELVRVGMNALFRIGDVIVRVGRPSAPAQLAIDLARRLRAHGIAAPEPVVDTAFTAGDLAATCWQRLPAVDAPIDWRAVGSIVAQVHELVPSDLPSGYPVPSPTSFPWWDFAAIVADVGDEIDSASRAGLEAAVERNAGWGFADGPTVICHGDVHPGNVMMTDDGPVLLDWDLMCRAQRGWDHAMLLTLAERWGGDARAYPAFAAGYGESLADDTATRRYAELRNVAATLMRVRAGRTDPTARDEAERRLQFWRGDPAAPQWRAQ